MRPIEQMAGQRFRVRSRIGVVGRLFGLPFVGFGAWIGVAPLFLNFTDWMLGHITTSTIVELVPGTLIGIAIGIPMLCVGLAMAFLRHSVEIDLLGKSVTEVNDLFFRKLRKSYPLDAVKSVVLSVTEKRGKDTTSYFVNALIATNTDLLTVASEPARLEQDVREIAIQIAEILGVTLEDKISDD